MKGPSRLVTRHPLAALLAVVALTLLALGQIVDPRTRELKLEIDPSVESLLPAEDAARTDYDHVRRLFGSDDTVLVALVAAYPRKARTQAALDALQVLLEERRAAVHSKGRLKRAMLGGAEVLERVPTRLAGALGAGVDAGRPRANVA